MPNDAATTRVLVWDDQDMHSTLASVLVDEPADVPEIDLEAVFLWLDGRCQGDEAPDAYLFTTVEPGREAADVERITDIRTKGFGAVVRRGRNADGSVRLTELLRRHVDTTLTAGSVTELVVASHDGERLAARLQDIAGGPVNVTVLGFRERALFAADHPGLRFVDLEDVPGAFARPLPRTNLYDLTDEGRVLPALRRPRGASGRRTRHAPDWAAWPRTPPSTPTPTASPTAGAAPGAPATPTPGRPAWAAGAGAPAPAHAAAGEPATPAPADAAGSEAVSPPPASGGALDDLLAGVQASTLAPSPAPAAPRPGRVSPPNGSPEPPAEGQPD